MFRKWDAYKLYLFMRAVATLGFTITFTTNMVYQVATVGLNPLQLVLVGTTLELTAFIFEIPTGVVADAYSRRLSVIIGYALIGVGFIVEAIPTFATVLLAQVIWGVGFTFISGAADAWMVDEIGEQRATRAFVRAEQVSLIASLVAIVISIALAMRFTLNTPHVIGGSLLLMLSGVLVLVMPEEGFSRVPKAERETWRNLFDTLGNGIQLIRTRHILLMIVLTSLTVGLFSEGWDRLWTAHFLTGFGLPEATQNETLLLFGGISMVGSIISLIASEGLRRYDIQSHRGITTALALLYGMIGFGVIGFANANSLVMAVAALWFTGAARTLTHPLYLAWINKHTESRVRATVLSVASQANALGQFVGGPAVGWVGNVRSLRAALTIAGVMMLPTLGLTLRTREMTEAQPEIAAT